MILNLFSVYISFELIRGNIKKTCFQAKTGEKPAEVPLGFKNLKNRPKPPSHVTLICQQESLKSWSHGVERFKYYDYYYYKHQTKRRYKTT